MKSQTNQEITWSVLELTGLLEDEDSHVHVVRTTKHLALHPCHLANIQQGLNQILRSLLHTYDRELKGFVLTFKNPKLISNLGEIYYDTPFVHIDVDAEFYLFRPVIGCCVKGIVNKKGLDHIVVLVHKIYTISIPKSDDAEEWLGDLVEIGQEIRCCINHIDYMSRPPFICATLKSDYSQGCRINHDNAVEMSNGEKPDEDIFVDASIVKSEYDETLSDRERKKRKKRHKSEEDAFEDESISVVKSEKHDEDREQKKRKKRHKYEENVSGDEGAGIVKSERDGTSSDREQKKRKKRHKYEENVSGDENASIVKSERDGTSSDREQKKRKKRHKYEENMSGDEGAGIVKSERDGTSSDREQKKRKKRHKHEEDVIPKDESISIVKSEKHDEAFSDREQKKRKKRHKYEENVSENESVSIVKSERDGTSSDAEQKKRKKRHKHEEDVVPEDESATIVKSEYDETLSDRERKKRKRSQKPDEDVPGGVSESVAKSEYDEVLSDRERKKRKRKRTISSSDVLKDESVNTADSGHASGVRARADLDSPSKCDHSRDRKPSIVNNDETKSAIENHIPFFDNIKIKEEKEFS